MKTRGQNLTVHIQMAEAGGGWGNSYAVYSHVLTAEGGWATVVLCTCSNSEGVCVWGGGGGTVMLCTCSVF